MSESDVSVCFDGAPVEDEKPPQGDAVRQKEVELCDALKARASAALRRVNEASQEVAQVAASKAMANGALTQTRKILGDLDEVGKKIQSLEASIHQHFSRGGDS